MSFKIQVGVGQVAGWELHVYFREDETSDMIKAEYVWDGWRRWWGKKQHGSQTSMDLYVMLRSSDPTTHLTESHHGLLTREDLTVYKDVEFYLLVLLLAALGLCCHVQAFSCCSEQGLLSHCDVQASHCGGFSCCRAQALGCTGSVVVALEISCLEARGIFPHQGSNLCLLHWQEDS